MKNYFDKNLQYLLEKEGKSPDDLSKTLEISLAGAKIYAEDLLKLSNYFQLSIDKLIKEDLKLVLNKRKDIKLLILDIDGVMTDGGMYYTADNDEIKKFNTKDGRGIISFIKQGGQVGIISSGFKNEIIEQRARTLGIQNVYVGQLKKEDVLEDWVNKLNIKWSEVAFIGDDINDFNVMQKVGVAACPSDAVDRIKEISSVILAKEGGRGCVREFVEKYLCEVNI